MKTIKTTNNLARITSLVFCLFLTQNIYAGVAVIVNPNSTLDTAKKSEIKKIFLGKSKKISGQSVKPIDNGIGETRKKFLKEVVGKKPRSFKSYWTRLIFSGKASPLKSGKNDEEVKKIINSQENSIGFIDSKNVDDKVKVILIVE